MPKIRRSYLNRSELNQILQGDKNNKVFMPNEIFRELINGKITDDQIKIYGFYDEEGKKIEECKSSIHIAYAYSYVYLAHFMYRYCQYYYYTDYEKQGFIDEKMIKKVLCIGEKSTAYTYITKKDGLLEKLGYIRKTRDIPIEAILVENSKGKWELDDFVMQSEYPNVYKIPKNRQSNLPVKGIFREQYSEEDNYYNRTFYDISDTHQIDINIFIYCMADKELGIAGFYLYCFLYYKNKMFTGYVSSLENLVRLTGLGMKVIRTQLVNLEKRNMITNDHKPYCFDKLDSQKTKANTYTVNNYEYFYFSKQDYNSIPRQRKMSAEQYALEIGFVGESNIEDAELVNVSELNLPF